MVFKIYYTGLLHFCGHTVLHRKSINAAAKHYFASDALYYRVNEALMLLMIEAHQESSFYEELQSHSPQFDLKAYAGNFVLWYSAGLRSGDVPFIFYSGFVFGPGMLYRIAKQAISMRDSLMLFSLMLPTMGLFKIAGKHNLSLQCFLSLAKLLSSDDETVKALLANICLSYTGRGFHAVAADEMLEMLIGFVKHATGKKWDVANATVHTACNFYLHDVREALRYLSKGTDGKQRPKGKHVPHGWADTMALVTSLRKFNLFLYSEEDPRKGLGQLPAGLTPSGYEPPPAYVQAESGGLLDFSRPFSSITTPAYAAAARAAQEYLERSGVLDKDTLVALVVEQTSDTASTTNCEVCNVTITDLSTCTCCVCQCCMQCTLSLPGEDGRVCRVCAVPTEEEQVAMEAAGERGELVPLFE